jgi:tungstate transport system substrate-binding protein
MVAVAVLMVALFGCGSGPTLLVAAGTTLVDSGFLDEVAQSYTDATGVEIDVLGEASAQILALARTGTVDVTITHAPDLEQDFVDEGLASSGATVFVSRFVIAGPPGVELESASPAEAFAEIFTRGGPFVGRQDGSGTAILEAQIWRSAGVDGPNEPWYLSTGQGMGLTLQVASEREAFVLAELGSFLSARDLELDDVGIVDPVLTNPYTALGVAASDRVELADAFIEWLISDPGVAAIELANSTIFDQFSVYRSADR